MQVHVLQPIEMAHTIHSTKTMQELRESQFEIGDLSPQPVVSASMAASMTARFRASLSKADAVSEAFATRTSKSCLRHIPVLDPRGGIRQTWNFFLLMVMLFNLTEAPIRLSFDLTSNPAMEAITALADAFLITDILINFRTGYYEDAVLEKDGARIASRYVRRRFLIDVITSIPVSLIGSSMQVKAFRLLKVLRIPEVFRVLKGFDRTGGSVTTFTDTFAGVLSLLMTAHFSACAWNLVAWYDNADGPNELSWWWRYCDSGYWNTHGEYGCSVYQRWQVGFYYSMVTLSSTGYGDILPKTVLEVSLTLCLLVIGGIIYGYVLSVSMVLFMPRAKDKELEDRMQELLAYLDHTRMPDWLQRKVIAFYEYSWSHQFSEVEKRVLDGLPPIIRSHCTKYRYQDLIDSVPFLRTLGEDCVNELMPRFACMHCSAGEYIFKKGTIGQALFILKDGQLEVLTNDFESFDSPKFKLYPGDLFGEAIVSKAPSLRMASVRAVLRSYLLKLSKKDFHDVMEMFPEVAQQVNNLKAARLGEVEKLQGNSPKRSTNAADKAIRAAKVHPMELERGGNTKHEYLSADFLSVGHRDSLVKPANLTADEKSRPTLSSALKPITTNVEAIGSSGGFTAGSTGTDLAKKIREAVSEIAHKLEEDLKHEQQHFELKMAAKFAHRIKQIEELLQQ